MTAQKPSTTYVTTIMESASTVTSHYRHLAGHPQDVDTRGDFTVALRSDQGIMTLYFAPLAGPLGFLSIRRHDATAHEALMGGDLARLYWAQIGDQLQLTNRPAVAMQLCIALHRQLVAAGSHVLPATGVPTSDEGFMSVFLPGLAELVRSDVEAHGTERIAA